MKVLITGITGFAGSHLAEYIVSNFPKVEVHGTRRKTSKTENIAVIKSEITLHESDLTSERSVEKLIADIKPDKIFHLAANTFVPDSWKDPAGTFTSNVVGQINLLEAVKDLKSGGYDPLILVIGSSEEYGKVTPDEVPVDENTIFRPMSPYAVSKTAQDLLGFQYYQSHKLRIVRVRPFNHSGPRRGENFVDSNFAKQIAEIEKGAKEPILKVGNLEASKDFTDVRDIVRAYWLASEKCEPGEAYNICSGRGYKIQEVLDALLSLSTKKDISVEKDQKRMRPSEVPVLYGDYSKFKKATGWQPEIDFLTTTLKDTLDYWRERV